MSEDWRPGAQADRPPNLQKIEQKAGKLMEPSVDAAVQVHCLATDLEQKHWNAATTKQEYAELIANQLQQLDGRYDRLLLAPEMAQGSIAPPSPPPSPPSPDFAPAADSNQDPDRVRNLHLIEQKVEKCAKPQVDAAARERRLLGVNHYAKQLEEKHWQDAASTQEYAELITKQLQELDEILEPLVAQGLVARPLADSNQDREAAAATMRVDSGPILGAGSGSGAREQACAHPVLRLHLCEHAAISRAPLLRAQECEVIAMETEDAASALEDPAAHRPSHDAGDDSDDDDVPLAVQPRRAAVSFILDCLTAGLERVHTHAQAESLRDWPSALRVAVNLFERASSCLNQWWDSLQPDEIAEVLSRLETYATLSQSIPSKIRESESGWLLLLQAKAEAISTRLKDKFQEEDGNEEEEVLREREVRPPSRRVRTKTQRLDGSVLAAPHYGRNGTHGASKRKETSDRTESTLEETVSSEEEQDSNEDSGLGERAGKVMKQTALREEELNFEDFDSGGRVEFSASVETRLQDVQEWLKCQYLQEFDIWVEETHIKTDKCRGHWKPSDKPLPTDGWQEVHTQQALLCRNQELSTAELRTADEFAVFNASGELEWLVPLRADPSHGKTHTPVSIGLYLRRKNETVMQKFVELESSRLDYANRDSEGNSSDSRQQEPTFKELHRLHLAKTAQTQKLGQMGDAVLLEAQDATFAQKLVDDAIYKPDQCRFTSPTGTRSFAAGSCGLCTPTATLRRTPTFTVQLSSSACGPLMRSECA